jgi:Na+/phosphate symporter
LLLVFIHALPALTYYPYYLAYFNPLMGGPTRAAETTLMGWGEGMEQVADYLNTKPNANEMYVASTPSQTLLPYFAGTGENFYTNDIAFRADYVVLYLAQMQRLAPSPEIVRYFLAQEPEEIIIRPKFLSDELLTSPSLALDVARLEVGHLGDHILQMMLLAQEGMQNQNAKIFQELEKQDDAADILHAEINAYLSQIGKQSLSDDESKEYFRINQANANLESIGDVLETDLVTLGLNWVNNDLRASDTMRSLLNELFESVYKGVECAVSAVKNNDQTAAQETIAMRGEINQRVNAALERQARSLAESGVTRLDTLNAEFELTDKLKRIYTLSKRIARLWVPKEV